jgi:hypothetical protein
VATLSEKLQYIISVNADGAIRSFQTVGKSAEKELGKAQTQMDRLGSQFTKFGVGALATAGVAGVAFARMGQGAGTLGQTMQKVSVIFGDSADDVEAFGLAAAESLGLSKRAALDASARFATFGKVANKSGADLVDYSTELTKRAVDLASFWDTDLESAFTAISSGLQGEALPLRKYGILLDDITLRKRALSMEIYDGIGPLTAQQRIMAASIEIMEQNVDSIDDYKRTQNDLPNLQKRFAAELQNTKDALGSAVLPAMVAVTSKAGDLLESFNSLSPGVQDTIGTFAGFGVAALGVAGVASTVIGQTIKMRDNFTRLGPAASTAAKGLGALAAALAVTQAADAALGTGAFADYTDRLNAYVASTAPGVEDANRAIRESFFQLKEDVAGSAGIVESAWSGIQGIFSGDSATASRETAIEKTFKMVLAQGPKAAQAAIDAFRALDPADLTSGYGISTETLDAWQKQVDNAAGAAKALAGETTLLADANTELAEKVEVAKSGLEEYYNALENEAAFGSTIDSIAELAAAMEDGSLSASEQRAQLIDVKKSVIDYAEAIGGIPTESLTKVLALIDEGSYRKAAEELARVAAPKVVTLTVKGTFQWAQTSGPGSNSLGGSVPPSAVGSAAAKGAAAAKAINDSFNNAFAKANKAKAPEADTPRTAEEVMADWDTIVARLYAMGEWDVEQYRAHLQRRLGEYAKYSDDYNRVWTELRSLDEQEKARKDDAARAEQERLADEAQAEQDKVDNQHALGELSDAEYIAALQNRMAAYDRYSNEYVAIWKTIQGLRQKEFDEQQAIADAEQERRDKEEQDRQREIEAEKNKLAASRGDALGILTINITNTATDPQSVVRAIEQARRLYGSRWLAN